MKAYQSEALRMILRDPVGRKSLRAFLERTSAARDERTVADERSADVVVTSNGHRFSVRLVPTR
jgi:hypothetical protein